ncbi:MAG: RIP metalloprotease RseP [Pseudomonadota bacterium]
MGYSTAAFIIVLGVLIFFHELGHFLMARLFGVGVETFSLGFGPKIYKRKVGLTEYCLSAIPLGGYVKMIGEDPGAVLDIQDTKYSFTHKKLYQKMIIVAAGPLFNFLLAVLLFFCIFQVSGLYLIKPVVGEVLENSPAQAAGIRKGDTIVSIQGEPISSWEIMVDIIGDSKGTPLDVVIGREGQAVSVVIRPEAKPSTNLFGETVDKYMIGISASGDVFHQRLNPIQAMTAGIQKTWEISKLTVLSVVKMIQGTVSAKTLGGPIMIAQMAGEQAHAGMASLAFFIAMLSINLGIINLLPVPVLDGGHLFFFALEGISGKALGEGFREKANQLGVVLLVALMVFAFYNDILRLFNGG